MNICSYQPLPNDSLREIDKRFILAYKNICYLLGQSGGTGIQSVVAGTNISVDNTDPSNPVVSATGSAAPTWEDTLINQGSTPFADSQGPDFGGNDFIFDNLGVFAVISSAPALFQSPNVILQNASADVLVALNNNSGIGFVGTLNPITNEYGNIEPGKLTLGKDGSIIEFYSPTTSFYIDVIAENASENRTITLPNASGTVALEGRMVGILPFVNNAAALIGGLVIGDIYYTNVAGDGVLKIVI